MRPALSARLTAQHETRQTASRQRAREPLRRTGPVTVAVDGRELVNFCGNDYLGLATHPEIAAAMAEAARDGVGSGASALVSGYTPVHRELERRLADFFGFEAALLAVSGYQANLAVGQALLGRREPVLADRRNHASLNDGARLAGARLDRYRHANAGDAATLCTESTGWIATDGVFSMDGDLAPLPDLVDLADDNDLGLWLDDAHGVGVLGTNGRGIIEHFNIDSAKIDAFVATFGKSFGTQGAVIAGENALIEALVNSARGVIYSTAMAPPMAAATAHALDLVQSQRWRAQRLHDNIARFRQRLSGLDLCGSERQSGFGLLDSNTAIQPLIVGADDTALAMADALAADGFLVRAIRPPTVAEGTARLRITLSAAHAPDQVDALAASIERLQPIAQPQSTIKLPA